MSQTTLDDDALFDEAAEEIREDVEEALQQARASLPDSDAVWTIEADNALGVLNGLRSALDTADAREHLRNAKKWYTMGERADAFEDTGDLEDAIETVDDLLGTIADAREETSELAATLPELRSDLEQAHGDADVPEAEATDSAGTNE